MAAAVVDVGAVAGEHRAVKVDGHLGGHVLQQHGGAVVQKPVVLVQLMAK